MSANEHREAASQARGISRRAALRGIATGAGATATALGLDRMTVLATDPAMHTHLAAAASAQAAAAPFTPKALSAAQLETVATLAELIIPTTNTPAHGRRSSTGSSTTSWPTPSRPTKTAPVRSRLDGHAQHGALRQGVHRRHARTADRAADEAGRAGRSGSGGRAGRPFFTAIKGMTIAGYYSTKIGLEQELGDNGQLFNPVFESRTHKERQIQSESGHEARACSRCSDLTPRCNLVPEPSFDEH
jgi:hypothetical protein